MASWGPVIVGAPVRVILFGGTGMVGSGVLRECLLDPAVDAVLSISRTSTQVQSPKLAELLLPDLTDLSPVEERLVGYDAAFFCLGVSSVGKSEAEYSRVTYDLTTRVAETLARRNPTMTFVYVSGVGTDSTEKGRTMWARVKGRTENALLRMPFKAAFMFRPGIIQPRYGIRSKNVGFRVGYVVLYPVVLILKALTPRSITSTDRVGLAMIRVARAGWATPILLPADINAAAKLEADSVR